MRKVGLAAVMVAAAFVTGGCGQSVERLDGAAAPDGVGATSPSPSVTPSPSPSAKPTVTRTSAAPLVLGPLGLGKLRLGMTVKEAQATGMITGYHVVNYGANCGVADFRAGSKGGVFFTPNEMGLSNIYAYGGISTPEGIRLGSTYQAVKEAYPDFVFVIDDRATEGNGIADTPGNSKARYAITIDNGKVTALGLGAEGQLCQE
ncbi:hypothetical protein GCM10010112_85650 [Actinoplanes lobatus]|uniref:Lipoprotein n=1 Tax=Actinoplanes lobatus TaxID=113568 RepID=A0A7W7HG71_9ACTN|nr:hypothetical protein [Actinoplanes lobatus]MBB4749960.1 hypothetical protein [Actinoplanes lobatus]GGN95415.1 hypothetical protein GCM10010112_85650 [Actinoplanes lobatus]GIE45815.1 hypothetical protein Alo02nite_87130 [Actinoplanes lobatus]